jgi:uncharacterized protein
MDGIRLDASQIEGNGVFAERDFSTGAVVLTINDCWVVDANHPVPPGEDRYCDYLEAGKTVLMPVPERHINHSCDPNVYVKTIQGSRRVIARRPIARGEEITYDYCVNGYGDVWWTCHCGATRCRHSIHTDFFRLPQELQAEYLPLLDDWFVEERAAEVNALRILLKEDGQLNPEG